MRVVVKALLLVGAGAGLACAADQFSSSGDGVDGGDVGGDAASSDAAGDGGVSGDGAASGDWTSMQDPARWAAFDMATVNASARGYVGAVFDGRYVTFVPHGIEPNIHGIAMRVDTRTSFSATTSWAYFDVASVSDGGRGFAGGAFDGRTITFAPNGTTTQRGTLAAQVDTTAVFGLSAWTLEDIALVGSQGGYIGAAYDGRAIYLVPYGLPSLTLGVVIRHETKVDAGWQTYNLAVMDPNLHGFKGAVFDGRFMYFAPNDRSTIARYDTTATFNTNEAWTWFDVTQLTTDPIGFAGGVFDGRYVYFVPTTSLVSRVMRYDTRASFGDVAAWSSFDTKSFAGRPTGFFGGAFDGRYVYLVPDDDGQPKSVIARYDTTDPAFDKTTAWTTFDIASIDPQAKSFAGAAFDGRYVYLAPHAGSRVVRFEARTTPALPTTPPSGF